MKQVNNFMFICFDWLFVDWLFILYSSNKFPVTTLDSGLLKVGAYDWGVVITLLRWRRVLGILGSAAESLIFTGVFNKFISTILGELLNELNEIGLMFSLTENVLTLDTLIGVWDCVCGSMPFNTACITSLALSALSSGFFPLNASVNIFLAAED